MVKPSTCSRTRISQLKNTQKKTSSICDTHGTFEDLGSLLRVMKPSGSVIGTGQEPLGNQASTHLNLDLESGSTAVLSAAAVSSAGQSAAAVQSADTVWSAV